MTIYKTKDGGAAVAHVDDNDNYNDDDNDNASKKRLIICLK